MSHYVQSPRVPQCFTSMPTRTIIVTTFVCNQRKEPPLSFIRCATLQQIFVANEVKQNFLTSTSLQPNLLHEGQPLKAGEKWLLRSDVMFRWFLVPLFWLIWLLIWSGFDICCFESLCLHSLSGEISRHQMQRWTQEKFIGCDINKRFLFSDLQRSHKCYLFTDWPNLRMAEELEIQGKGGSAWPLYARAFKLWPPLETEHNESWKQINVLSAYSSSFPLPDC